MPSCHPEEAKPTKDLEALRRHKILVYTHDSVGGNSVQACPFGAIHVGFCHRYSLATSPQKDTHVNTAGLRPVSVPFAND